MEESSQKINFFNKIRIAIFKLEDYGIFLCEKFSASLKYFLLLICLVSIIFSALDTYNYTKMINKGYYYIQNELTDFIYQDGNLDFSQKIEAYDEEYKFRLIINTTSELQEDELNNYKNRIFDEDMGVILLKDKAIYIQNSYEEEWVYKEFEEMLGTNINNKEDLLNLIGVYNATSIAVSFFISGFIVAFLSMGMTVFLDIVMVAIFGLIVARFCGMRFKTLPMLSLSIYSMTLSVILTLIYGVVNSLTGFTINYFNIMYLLIAYIYIVAAIMMIKYDLIKQHLEMEKIVEVQKEVHEELEREKKEKESEEKETNNEEEKSNNKKDDNTETEEPDLNGREPDGSEI